MIKCKRNKFGNKKVVLYGIEFDSIKEGDRYLQLRLLLKAKVIKDLELQPKYRFVLKGILLCTYKADFKYFDCEKKEWVVEDVKSPATAKLPVFKMNKKFMKIFYDVEIKEG